MMKAWLCMWRNTVNFTGTATRKEFWLGLIMNLIAMYIGVVPYALILKNFTDNAIGLSVVYLIIAHLPVPALYFRRANDIGWKKFSTVYAAVTAPIISGLLAGVLPTGSGRSMGVYAAYSKAFALAWSLFFYGGTLGFLIYGDPIALPWLCMAGLLLISGIFIFYAITHWRELLVFCKALFSGETDL